VTPVLVESPFSGGAPRGIVDRLTFGPRRRQARNVRYARAAVRDCILRGEAPIASHLLYTQPGVLRDDVPEERLAGIDAGLSAGRFAAQSAIYVDLGLTSGMRYGIKAAHDAQRPCDVRTISGWRNPWWCRSRA
jgi:hypothetical protein